MHINSRTDQELKEALQNLLDIIPAYQHHYFYNRTLINPYLLSSHGLTISKKRNNPEHKQIQSSHSAVCVNPNCDLSFPLDDQQDNQLRQDLESLIKDHDSECPYFKVKDNLICFKLFVRLGRSIYQQALKQIQNNNISIQLNPSDFYSMIGNSETKEQSNQLFCSTLSQLRQLDPMIQNQPLTKVRSSVLLAIFGWKWASNTMLVCQFCGAARDTAQFISPLQVSLLKVQQGFQFIGAHHSWCCLVAPSQCFWRQILRQAVMGHLANVEGKSSKTWYDLECKSIQRNLISLFSENLLNKNFLKRQIIKKQETISLPENQMNNQDKQEGELEAKIDMKTQLNNCLSKLKLLMEEQLQSQEKLILQLNTS